ncbi:MAG TPA: molecular chaperone HtpG [Spirochaetales bacterium]|nr:molecular chaperone HtpG [Spirochaetales bacterium]
MGKYKFQAEVSRMLHLIIHSLYSHPEVFLRELISNASDALDRLRYLTLTDDDYKGFAFIPKIDISFKNHKQHTISVSDTGIGMSAEDLEKNLGTIASSGTQHFVESLSGDVKTDSNLIGQFGVGFYSSFMVADRIEVTSLKAGEEKAHRWISDGQGEFEITEAEKKQPGTEVTLYLNEDGKKFAERWQIENIIQKYSNHIAFPIFLHYQESRFKGEGEKRIEKKENKVEQINSASALWMRPKSKITDEDYNSFYKTISHDNEDPLHFIHTQVEGALQYTTLFYIPSKAPFDLYFANYRPGVKLYVRRVFITDDEKELLPTYLRFIQGIIDSDDLPLNVNREILQQNKILAKIRSTAVKKILNELKKIARHNMSKYENFYKEFGRPIKEGLFQDSANRDTLLELVRFKSTSQEGLTSLNSYKERMLSDQKAIYYITGENEANLKASPLLEAYKKRGIEVLIMDDEIDEIIISVIDRYKDTELKAINRSDAAEDLKSEEDKKEEKTITPLVKRIARVLKDDVKEVRASTALIDSPSCILADEKDPSFQMQQIFKAMGQKEIPATKPILEVNPNHEIIKKLGDIKDEELFGDISRLLYEQALLIEGIEVKNPAQLVGRLNRMINLAL